MNLKEKFSVSNFLTQEQANLINDHLNLMQDDQYWARRDLLGEGRSVEGEQCGYDFMGLPAMSPDFRKLLLDIVPKEDGYFIGEICINRYKPGDYIGKHVDRALYRMNRVVALNEDGDGLYINDKDIFIEDKKGQAVTLYGTGPVHSVPPVKKLRHVLIVLYE